jgi:hypothetical protein
LNPNSKNFFQNIIKLTNKFFFNLNGVGFVNFFSVEYSHVS